MDAMMSVDEMRQQLEQLEAEEEQIDVELGKLIKQQPDLLIKGNELYFKYSGSEVDTGCYKVSRIF